MFTWNVSSEAGRHRTPRAPSSRHSVLGAAGADHFKQIVRAALLSDEDKPGAMP